MVSLEQGGIVGESRSVFRFRNGNNVVIKLPFPIASPRIGFRSSPTIRFRHCLFDCSNGNNCLSTESIQAVELFLFSVVCMGMPFTCR